MDLRLLQAGCYHRPPGCCGMSAAQASMGNRATTACPGGSSSPSLTGCRRRVDFNTVDARPSSAARSPCNQASYPDLPRCTFDVSGFLSRDRDRLGVDAAETETSEGRWIEGFLSRRRHLPRQGTYHIAARVYPSPNPLHPQRGL